MLWSAAEEGASTGSDTLDLILPFLNFGLLAVFVIFLLAGKFIVTRREYDKAIEDAEHDATEAEARHTREMADRDAGHVREMDLLRAQLTAVQQDKEQLATTNGQLTRVAQEQFLPALIEANRITLLYTAELQRRASPGSQP